ncbi:hypothetical protein RAK27_19135 [Carnobacterium maltaromaticum]|uniref:Cell division protein FtsL n=1 Tax=Carnobacterium maltaromaticum TaxID=2751 RepID=A0AAW9JW66_CARML|nr:hypothetical protein [Carnobacterium maltaromaticum]MDZ5760762.1 hypothetical protein [Carnobacterium maltaromaticum]
MVLLIFVIVLVILIGLVVIIAVQARENKKLMNLTISLELDNLKLEMALSTVEEKYMIMKNVNRSGADGN